VRAVQSGEVSHLSAGCFGLGDIAQQTLNCIVSDGSGCHWRQWRPAPSWDHWLGRSAAPAVQLQAVRHIYCLQV